MKKSTNLVVTRIQKIVQPFQYKIEVLRTERCLLFFSRYHDSHGRITAH
jgi:hypothetical protein